MVFKNHFGIYKCNECLVTYQLTMIPAYFSNRDAEKKLEAMFEDFQVLKNVTNFNKFCWMICVPLIPNSLIIFPVNGLGMGF